MFLIEHVGAEHREIDRPSLDIVDFEAQVEQAIGRHDAERLRIDRDVLDYFQEDGPGWQDRINAALRKAAGK